MNTPDIRVTGVCCMASVDMSHELYNLSAITCLRCIVSLHLRVFMRVCGKAGKADSIPVQRRTFIREVELDM